MSCLLQRGEALREGSAGIIGNGEHILPYMFPIYRKGAVKLVKNSE
jgi:hypothetical protein